MVRYQSIRERGFNEEDSTNLNMITKSLATVGIKAADAQGNLRDFQDILDELAPKWKTLTDKQQDYIQTQIAGTYQANRFAALMNGYGDSLKYYELALNSAGTAQKKFDIYMESNEAKANQFKSTMDKLWMDTFNSESFGKLIEFGTDVTNVVDNIGLLNIAITVLSLTTVIFSKNLMTGLIAVRNFTVGLATMNFTLAAINPWITAIVIVLGLLALALANSKSELEAFNQKVDEQSKKFDEEKKSVDDLSQSLKALNEADDALVVSHTSLYDIYLKIRDINPDILNGIDLQTASVKDLRDALSSASTEALKAKRDMLGLSAAEAYTKYRKGENESITYSEIYGEMITKTPMSEEEKKKWFDIYKQNSQEALVIRNQLYGDEGQGRGKEWQYFDEPYKAPKPPKGGGGGNGDKPDLDAPYKPLLNIIRDISYELDLQNEKLSQASEADKIPILNARNALLEKQKDALHALNEARRAEQKGLKTTSERYQELQGQIQQTSLEWWKLDSIQQQNLDTMNKINETLLKSQLETVIDGINEQKKAEEERHDAYMDNINEEIKKLDEQYAKEDYDKNIKKQDTAISEKQAEINALALDNSVEGMAKKAELQKELDELLLNKADEVEKHKRDVAKDTLEDLKDEETKAYNDKIKMYDDLINELNSYNDNVLDLTNTTVDAIIVKYEEMAKAVGVSFASIKTDMQGVQIINDSSGTGNTGGGSGASLTKDVKGSYIDDIISLKEQYMKATSDSARKSLHDQADEIRKLLPPDVVDATNAMTAEQLRKYKQQLIAQGRVYAQGGSVNYTGFGWMDGSPSKPEYVLKSIDFKMLLDTVNLVRNLMPNINMTKIPSINNNTNKNITMQPTVNIYSVSNENVDRLVNRVKTEVFDGLKTALALDGK